MQKTDFIASLYREGKVSIELLIIVETIGLQAAAIIRSMLKSGNFNIDTKSHSKDFVTDIDHAVNDYLKEKLMELDPDFGWVSEESKKNKFREFTWVIDPIDGTYGLVNQNSEYAISIALVKDGVPILGVVVSPTLGFQDMDPIRGHMCRIIAGAKGVGIFVNGKPIGPRWRKQPRLLLGWPDFHNCLHFDIFRQAISEKLLMGSVAWRIANIAAATAEIATTTYPSLAVWDIAAGHAILLAADGKLTDGDNNPISYTDPEQKIKGLVASNNIKDNHLLGLFFYSLHADKS